MKGISFDKEEKLKAWGRGPWVDEKDFERFVHKGIECLVRRTDSGILCGYVIIPEDSFFNGLAGLSEFDEAFDVHGGITCYGVDENDMIIIGFDCAHPHDICPLIQKNYPLLNEKWKAFAKHYKLSEGLKSFFTPTYKTWDFVMEETKRLADQILEKDKELK